MERRDLLRKSAAPFNRTLHTAALPSIMLDYYELQPHLGPRLRCRGPPCPKFGHCGSAFPHVQACWNEHLIDPRPLFPADPLNCPRLQPVEDVGRLRRPWYFIDSQCSHRVDVNARDATAMQVFKMKDVYSAFGGYVFNLTHRFNRNGCKRFLKVPRCAVLCCVHACLLSSLIVPCRLYHHSCTSSARSMCFPGNAQRVPMRGRGAVHWATLTPNMTVYHLKEVFNWDYRQAGNFYHFIIEAVPLLYAAARLLPSLLPDVPIAAKGDQVSAPFIADQVTPAVFLPPVSLFSCSALPPASYFRCPTSPSPPLSSSLAPPSISPAPPTSQWEWEVYDQIGLPIVGVPREDMWTIRVRAWEIVYADTMYQPMAQTCGGPNKALWTHLRRHHLLPPGGLPLFHRNWTLRSVPPLADQDMAALPPNWVVVLGKRPMAKRALVNWDGLRDAVYASFESYGSERIVVFQGDLRIMEARALFRRACLFVSGHRDAFASVIFMPASPLLPQPISLNTPCTPDACSSQCTPLSMLPQLCPTLLFPIPARALFRRARLFVSGHGAAFANVIFMPANASIYEIRPRKCYNACYNNLAHACSVRYHLSFGDGTCYSSLKANLTHVRETLSTIAQRFRDEDATIAEQ
ncbi:unnamed protein product [Closterium sp. NIES-65]|nr:unnamed protein product [Closterium sp. NIES-65]